MANNTDQYLIAQILKGDTQAFATLVEKYQDYVFTIAVRMLKSREEAEEVAQDTFIKVFNSLRSFKGDSKFSTWLYSIVYRKSLDQIRKNKNKVESFTLLEEITQNHELDTVHPSEVLEIEERNQKIKECIQKLGHTDAALVTFFYFDELTLKEIATVTNLTVDNVKIRLFRSRKKLLDLMQKHSLFPESLKNHG